MVEVLAAQEVQNAHSGILAFSRMASMQSISPTSPGTATSLVIVIRNKLATVAEPLQPPGVFSGYKTRTAYCWGLPIPVDGGGWGPSFCHFPPRLQLIVPLASQFQPSITAGIHCSQQRLYRFPEEVQMGTEYLPFFWGAAGCSWSLLRGESVID